MATLSEKQRIRSNLENALERINLTRVTEEDLEQALKYINQAKNEIEGDNE